MAKAKKPARIDAALRAAIRKSGLSHYAIGKLASVAPSVIDRFVAGERDIRLATAAELAACLGLVLTSTESDVDETPSGGV